jgi:hypothetical protein
MLFRNRKLVRGLACFFLLETLTTLAGPTVSLAMMGPGQPEFTSYESGGSPDLVNLTTGDFTYNIPVIDVPGPERGFSLPLTYRAGIKLEQEASWVGLGWSLNAGAIARSLTGYPDDANGEIMQSTYNQKITRGWEGGVPGILELAWDVNTGHSGSASLIGLVGLGWSGGSISSGSLVGVHASKEGITPNLLDIVAAGMTIATLGGAGSVGALVGSVASQLGSDVGTGVAASVLLGKANSGGGAFGEPTVKEDKGFLHTNYWVFYNDKKLEFMYGSLNFDVLSKQVNPTASVNPSPYVYTGSPASQGVKSPEYSNTALRSAGGNFEAGPGADLYQYNAQGTDYWKTNSAALSVAHDDFSVMGGNVSGNIRPYRLEVGSVAFPFKGLNQHSKFATVPYLNYKVPFRYENSVSNSYTYHQFTPSAATTSDGLGIEGYEQPTYSESWPGGIVLKDPSLYGSATRTEATRKGIINQTGADGGRDLRLVQGKNVKWFTNNEIATTLYGSSTDGPGDGSFLEINHPTAQEMPNPPRVNGYTTCPPSDPDCQPQPTYDPATTTTSNNPWRITLPGKGIGAFAVTAEDGTTYHYSLPVYHYTQYSTSYQKKASPGAESPGVSTQTLGPQSWDLRGGGFATTWLLTAITSSDYVDRGSLGTIDDADWGGWVRFDYGKFASAYKWRQPYLGETYSENSYNDASYSEGYKETYYLNSIRTRTHTALFLKSLRNDARGHYQAGASHLGISESRPASSLRLDEIILLNNTDLQKLKTADGIRLAGDSGPTIPAFSENTAGNNSQYDASELQARDTYRNVFDRHDAEIDGRIRTYLNQQALKRVVFNYSYRLCASTPNSFVSATSPPSMDEAQFPCTRTGKLTLESLSTYGPANTKLTPDFKFQYGFNPDYQKDSWDAFGMYKSGVVVNTNLSPKSNHQVSPDYPIASNDGAAWSLTQITSPLGGITNIGYERDQYASVSEYFNDTYQLTDSGTAGPTGTLVGNNTIDLTTIYRPNDIISLSGNTYQNYTLTVQPTDPYSQEPTETTNGRCGTAFKGDFTIAAVTANSITLASPPQPTGGSACAPSGNNPSYNYQYNETGYGGCEANIRIPLNRNGGDLRVATISILDETGNASQIRYDYTTNQPATRNSSGVISKEPAYVVREAHDFDTWFDYPGTSVMYGKTAVLRGLFRSNNAADYSQKEEYTFQTPSSTMVQAQHSYTGSFISKGDDPKNPYQAGSKGFRQLDKHNNTTVINLGAIGQPLAIRKINRQGNVESTSTFEYGNSLSNTDGIAKQGTFTEGVMTNELLGDGLIFYRINRSTKVYQPTVLLATTTTTNGVSTRSQQEKFDFYTGQVLESSFRNFLGELYRSKVVPAYTLPNYVAMGPASQNSANRNMLTQQAASYLYKVRPSGSQAVVSAGVQTWNGNWATYRGYDAGTDTYGDRADDPRAIWRLSESYTWVSPRLNADGTYADADFTDFSWSRRPLTKQARGWVKAGEFTRYDHYSKPLESADINGQYVTRKLGYGLTQRVVTAANARFTEVAYSGAEDQVDQGNGTLHFGGEVRDGGKRSTTYQHTGAYSTVLKPGEQGFTYKVLLGSSMNSEARRGRKYRLSCWVHKSDATARLGQLYAQVDGQDMGTATIASPATKQAGDWYLLNLLVDAPASGQRLIVGCRHAGTASGQAAIYFDDFRFQPVEGPATAYVYDAYTGQLTYVLDNDNLFTHYEYDAAGKVKRVSKEVLTPTGSTQPAERRIKEYEYNFAQMPTPNWLPTGTVTWANGTGGQSQLRQHEEQDINPLSPLYRNTRLVADGNFPMCAPPCPGSNQERVNGQCLTYDIVCTGSVLIGDCPATAVRCSYQNTYVKRYSNGTSSAPFDELSDTPCVR